MRILIVILLASPVLLIVSQQREINEAREELRHLQKAHQEMERLSRENASLNPIQVDPMKLDRLREATRDIHKVRGRILYYREKTTAIEKLKRDNARLGDELRQRLEQSQSSERPFGKVLQPIDAGQATPEATLQTVLWAMSQGRVEKLLQCFPPFGWNLQKMTEEDRRMVIETTAANFGGERFAGFQILETKELTTDEVHLMFALLKRNPHPAEGERAIEVELGGFILRRENHLWCVVH